MKGFVKISMILWIVLTMLASCRAISRFLHDDEVVAEVDGVVLYRSDLDDVLPTGLSDDDSLRLAAQYINSWASDQVFLGIAEQQLSKAEKPWIAVCGNHDLATDIPDNCLYARVKEPVQVLDLGDLIIVGVDNSQRQVTKDQTARLLEVLALGKPVIVTLHVPIMTEDNREKLLPCGDYFRLNHPDATDETLAFIDTLRQNAGQIVAVLAGHLHFHMESTIAPGLPQFVNSQSVLGNINRYEIGE